MLRDVTAEKYLRTCNNTVINSDQTTDALAKIDGIMRRVGELISPPETLQQEAEGYRSSSQFEDLIHTCTTELMRANERFYKAFTACPSLMAIYDTNGRIIDANGSFAKVTGWDKEALIARPMAELKIYAPETSEHIRELFWQQGYIRNIEVNLFTKTGQERCVLLSAETIVWDDQVCMLVLMNDITEIKLLEREMVRFDRLNLVGQMAAGISHEIRNPMTTVRGFLQLLRIKPGCSQYQEYFDLMISELDRANSIISEFLSIAKPKHAECVPLDLSTVIHTIEPLLSADAVATGKSVELKLRELPLLNLNEKEIRQLILNLVRNGFEAMPEPGIVTISAYPEQDTVVLAVTDRGTGIRPDILDQLGTPFITSKDKGTGLGLAVCYGIAERHKATIDVKTGTGGTTFYVRFKI